MTVKTQYICDRCQSSQPTPEQFWLAEVSALSFGSDRRQQYKQIQVCRPCLESLGFLVRPKPGVTPPPPPTVEELVREIFRLCADEVAP